MIVPRENAKASLRQQIRARLRDLSPRQQRDRSLRLCRRLLAQPEWQRARVVLLFAPLRDEPDIWRVIASALIEGKEVSVPKFDPAGSVYQASPVRDLEDLMPGKFGVLEPRANSEMVPLNRLDLVLVPGIAFDIRGGRLGRGQGYYDRLLATVNGLKCGVAFDEQLVDAVPVEPHDVCLNRILTPTRWIET